MIPYLDASALVKRYVQEPGSEEVGRLIARARVAGTSAITRVEVTAALARAVRRRALEAEEAMAALEAFQGEWESWVRVDLTEVLLGRAAQVAWERGLHLASALFWQEILWRPTIGSCGRRRVGPAWGSFPQRGHEAAPRRWGPQERDKKRFGHAALLDVSSAPR
jgi:predicted nucleic acid-binding protein